MKILVQYWNSEGSGSAFEVFVETIATLSKSNSVSVLLSAEGKTSRALSELPVQLFFARVEEPNLRSLYVPYVISLLRHLLLLFWGRFELVYVFDFNFWKPSFFFAARLLNVPVVSHVRYIFRELRGNWLGKSALVLCNSDATRKVSERLLPGVSFRTIHNFLPSRLLEMGLVERTSVDVVRIGYVGALLREKGVEILIRAFALLGERRKISLEIYGREKETGVLSELETLASTLGVAGSVHFHGEVSFREQIFPQLDILCLPSLEEAFGFVLIEAAAYSLPVVASQSGAVPEIVEHGTSGILVPPGDVSAFANALEKLIEDESLRTKLGKAGRKIVEEKFSAESLLRNLEEIFSEVSLQPG